MAFSINITMFIPSNFISAFLLWRDKNWNDTRENKWLDCYSMYRTECVCSRVTVILSAVELKFDWNRRRRRRRILLTYFTTTINWVVSLSHHHGQHYEVVRCCGTKSVSKMHSKLKWSCLVIILLFIHLSELKNGIWLRYCTRAF